MVKVKIPIKGGLGNQMFCYAYSEFLKSQGYQTELLWRDYLFTKQHNGIELDRAFGIEFSERDKRLLRLYTRFNKFFQTKTLKILASKFVKEFDKISTRKIFEQSTPFSFCEISYEAETLANGFWQNNRYLDPIRPKLLKIFSFKLPLEYEKSKIVALITSVESVALHIRRGDYLDKEFADFNVFGEKLDYHAKAIDKIRSIIPDALFFVFSDDIKWCKKKLVGSQYYFVDTNKGINSYLDMYLMSLCKHIIIANSTFSWWAAYLHNENNHDKHLVVAPKIWNNNGINTDSFSPQSWIYM